MRSGLFKLNKKNWIKALIVAVSGALFMYFAPFFTDGSGKDIFDITKVDLINAGKDALKAGASYIFASLFFTDGSGKDIFDITKVDLINAGKDALKAGASYIFASLFFNSEGKFLKKEVK